MTPSTVSFRRISFGLGVVAVISCTHSFAQLADPFAGVRSQADNVLRQTPEQFHGTKLDETAVRSSRFTEESFDMCVTDRIFDHDTLVFTRGWTGEGTGYAEVSVQVFQRAAADSVARKFRAVIDFESVPSKYVPTDPTPHFGLHGCVLQAGDHQIAYAYTVSGPDGERSLGDSTIEVPPPRPGYYLWEASRHQLTWVRAPDTALWHACAAVPSTMTP